MSYGDRETKKTILGHSCVGGGAKINNSPINIHFHFHAEKLSTIDKIKEAINATFGRGNITIDGVDQLSQAQLQGRIVRELENR